MGSMIKDTDLHLYLNESPDMPTLDYALDGFDFNFDREIERTKAEPHTYFFSRSTDGPSGIQLIYFSTLFTDDLNFGEFRSFVIINAFQDSPETDINLVDQVAARLLLAFGGHLHNPQRIERISTNYFLSGEQYIAQKVEDGLA